MKLVLDSIEVVRISDDDPDLSWLTDESRYMGEPEAATYMAQDAERLASYGSAWWCVGIRAVAHLRVQADHGAWLHVHDIESPGLWGIASDSGEAYFAEVGSDELVQLREMLLAFGLSAAEIDAADFDPSIREA